MDFFEKEDQFNYHRSLRDHAHEESWYDIFVATSTIMSAIMMLIACVYILIHRNYGPIAKKQPSIVIPSTVAGTIFITSSLVVNGHFNRIPPAQGGNWIDWLQLILGFVPWVGFNLIRALKVYVLYNHFFVLRGKHLFPFLLVYCIPWIFFVSIAQSFDSLIWDKEKLGCTSPQGHKEWVAGFFGLVAIYVGSFLGLAFLSKTIKKEGNEYKIIKRGATISVVLLIVIGITWFIRSNTNIIELKVFARLITSGCYSMAVNYFFWGIMWHSIYLCWRDGGVEQEEDQEPKVANSTSIINLEQAKDVQTHEFEKTHGETTKTNISQPMKKRIPVKNASVATFGLGNTGGGIMGGGEALLSDSVYTKTKRNLTLSQSTSLNGSMGQIYQDSANDDYAAMKLLTQNVEGIDISSSIYQDIAWDDEKTEKKNQSSGKKNAQYSNPALANGAIYELVGEKLLSHEKEMLNNYLLEQGVSEESFARKYMVADPTKLDYFSHEKAAIISEKKTKKRQRTKTKTKSSIIYENHFDPNTNPNKNDNSTNNTDSEVKKKKRKTTSNSEKRERSKSNLKSIENLEINMKELGQSNSSEENNNDNTTNSLDPTLNFETLLKESNSRNWTREFQDIVQGELLARGAQISKLLDDFEEKCSDIGKIIIKETNLPLSEKQHLPCNAGGFAGGEKYFKEGIFFKYAKDNFKLFGGDDHAMKVAALELKGLSAYVSYGMSEGLNFPLMVLVDYGGYRLTCISLLPINKDTLVYGSSDGGNTIYNDNPKLNQIMEKVANSINIKKHAVGKGENAKQIAGPFDIEGHIGTDEKFYAIDFARVFPPLPRTKGEPGSCIFYKLMRPELVRKWPHPLNSDAFTVFSTEEEDKQMFMVDQYLRKHQIPKFVKQISGWKEATTNKKLIQELHRNGINVRLLGLVRNEVQNPTIRALILVEILARQLKNQIRALYRQLKSYQEPDDRKKVFKFLALVFLKSEKSDTFWLKTIKQNSLQNFPDTFSDIEFDKTTELRQKYFTMDNLFARVLDISGFSIISPKSSDFEDFKKCISEKQYSRFKLEARSKRFYAVPRLEADTFAHLAMSGQEVEKNFAKSYAKYKEVLSAMPDDEKVFYNWGSALHGHAVHCTKYDRTEANKKFISSRKKLEKALIVEEGFTHAHTALGNNCLASVLNLEALGNEEGQNFSTEIKKLLKRGEKAYRTAVESNRKFEPLLFNYALLLSLLSKYSETPMDWFPHSAVIHRQLCDLDKDQTASYLVNYATVLINWVFTQKNLEGKVDETKLDLAESKLLQAQAIEPGVGAFKMACVSCTKGNEKNCKYWLKKSLKAGYPSSVEVLVAEPTLEVVKNKKWFQAAVEARSKF